MISKQQITTNKEKLIEILNKCPRIKDSTLISYLESTDFFIAPASTIYHNNCPGGLVDHSLKVYKLFKEKCKRYNIDLSIESQRIVTLLHDLCKINKYVKGFRWKKDESTNNQWKQQKTWKWIYDDLLVSHGSKSVYLILDYIKLNNQEKMLIEWHSGGWHLANSYEYSSNAAIYPPIILLYHADFEASLFLEKSYIEYDAKQYNIK